MKTAKTSKKQTKSNGEMLTEYDFSRGVRGKHFKNYRKGYTVSVNKLDGSVDVQHFGPAEGSVMLEPDVKAYFPDSASVNKALRGLITLLPKRSKTRTAT